MAVKQNNTEANGTSSSVGGNSGNTTNGTKTSGAATGGTSAVGGTKTKKMNPNASGSGNGEQPGCSGVGTGASAKQKVSNNNSSGGMGGGSIGGGGGTNIAAGMVNKPNDIAHILNLIELVEMNQQQVGFEQELLIYHHLIVELSRVQIPRQSPEDLKRFKEDIAKVFAFFAKSKEKRVYLYYLRIVCQLITQSDGGGETPSCAIAVIFQLFNAEMVFEAVQSLLEHKIPDQNIRKTVRLLSEWLRMCNFCQNLNLWIMAILSGLQDQQKFALFEEIALENIEQLFVSLILPVLRPKVAPIVFHMLSSISQTPQVFHKILQRIPYVMNYLKQQSNSREEYAEETKKLLQQLVDLTSALMVRFYGYDHLYEAVELALKDFRPSYNYLNSTSSTKSDGDFATDTMLHNTNAKVGLVNLGNTCYMNSVLQALAMTKEFSREILLSESKSPLLIKMQQQIALMLYSTRYELTPSRVLNATRPPGFSPGLQQDSSEFLGYLLETLHEQEMAYCKKTAAASKSTMSLRTPTITRPQEMDAEPIAKTAKQTNDNNIDNENKQPHCNDEHYDDVDVDTSNDVKIVEEFAQVKQSEGATAIHDVETATTITTTPTSTVSKSDNMSNTIATANNTNSTTTTGNDFRSTNSQQHTTDISTNRHIATSAAAATTSIIATTTTTSSSSSNYAAVSSTNCLQSTIEKTFTGKLATTYKCLSCGWKSRNIDSFRDLQLSFPEVKNDCASNYSVQDLIDYYCSPEKLYGDNQYFCEKCKKLNDAERYINVISAPKNLILTLKHFKYDQKYHMRAKLMHKVFHDEKVSVKVCAAETLDEIASVHYDLYAGVVHSGFSMDSGHYYTYASDASNKWYKFNDSIVTPSQSEELHNLTPPNTPYILFYQMAARSNDILEAAPASTKVIKVDVPVPLKIEELPSDLRDYVNHDNCVFSEELKLRRFKNANAAAIQNALKAKNNKNNGGSSGGGGSGGYGNNHHDDDDDQPPPTSGCGGNAMNINVNRFVY